jgi:hypothetical protein
MKRQEKEIVKMATQNQNKHVNVPTAPVQMPLPGLLRPWCQRLDFHDRLSPFEKSLFSPVRASGSIGVTAYDMKEIERLMGLNGSHRGTHDAVGWWFLDVYETIVPGSSHVLRRWTFPSGVRMYRMFHTSTVNLIAVRMNAMLSTTQAFTRYENFRRHHGMTRVNDWSRKV